MFFMKTLIFGLAILGAPLFLVIGSLALISFSSADIDLSVVVIEMTRLADTPMLISLPLFIFAGVLLSEGGAPGRMLRFSSVFFRWLPGGMAVIALLLCAVFTAFTGASGITIFALGGLLLPALTGDGYTKKFSMGLITSSGSLGLLFPPSLPLILYGVISESRIDQLFLAGIMPGCLMLLLLIGFAITQSPPKQLQDNVEQTTKVAALKEVAWELPLPIILLGGIYGGYLVPSEAAAVTALYVLLTEILIHRDIPLRRIPSIMGTSMVLFGGILVILAASMSSTNYLIDQEVPSRLFAFISGYIDSKYTFLLLLNIFLLIVGAMLDIFSALVLIVPLILPIATGYGIDPIHLGIIFLTNMQIGYCTPPVGLNLFLASYRFERPVTELYRASLPFLLILLVTLVAITYLPWLSTGLISLMK